MEVREHRKEKEGEQHTYAMSLNQVEFSYGKHAILKNVSFVVKEKKITTILGANGSGKSTLFSLMTKDLSPQNGTITLYNEDIRQLNLKEFAKKVSIVHQYNTSSDDITVEQLVAYGRTPYRKMMMRESKEDGRLIQWAMEVTNTITYRKREVSKLSGGQRQRVWIAMALAQNTSILFLDEPTTYLDIRYQIEILELVKRLNREYGITIIMVLHDINQAIQFSDYIIGLKDGHTIISGKPKDVISEKSIQELYGIKLTVDTIGNRQIIYSK